MKACRLVPLIIALTLLAVLAVAAGAQAPAAPTNVGCQFGEDYDPACDVDHDGDVDIFDIQLTAGHWGHDGTWTIEPHNHLGETWTGSNNSLKITGFFGDSPNLAPLIVGNSAALGDALRVNSAGGDAVHIDSAGWNGVNVHSAGYDGVYIAWTGNSGVYVFSANGNGLHVETAVGDGVYVFSAGADGMYVGSAGSDGVRVGSAGHNGLYVYSAGHNGLYVNSAGHDGAYVGSAGSPSQVQSSSYQNGLEVAGAQGHGVFIGRADLNGIEVKSTGYHGLYVGSTGHHGVKVDYPTLDGLFVNSAGQNGVYANTTRTDHEWGIYTPDKIYAGATALSALTIIAQVTGQQVLTTGDVVAAVGVTDPMPDSSVPLALVQPAGSGSSVIGVVEGRMALTPKPQHEDEQEGEPVLELRSAEGPAMSGDYVALTVLGVAQVKVDAGVDIRPGQRLTAADSGKARTLKTVEVEGIRLAEDTPTIGVALASPEPGQPMIPVFITLQQ